MQKINDEQNIKILNTDRLLFIVLWPCIIVQWEQ